MVSIGTGCAGCQAANYTRKFKLCTEDTEDRAPFYRCHRIHGEAACVDVGGRAEHTYDNSIALRKHAASVVSIGLSSARTQAKQDSIMAQLKDSCSHKSGLVSFRSLLEHGVLGAIIQYTPPCLEPRECHSAVCHRAQCMYRGLQRYSARRKKQLNLNDDVCRPITRLILVLSSRTIARLMPTKQVPRSYMA